MNRHIYIYICIHDLPAPGTRLHKGFLETRSLYVPAQARAGELGVQETGIYRFRAGVEQVTRTRWDNGWRLF